MDSKPWFASKTLWVNGLAVAAAILAGMGMDILPLDLQADIVAAIMAIVNIVLRFVTKKPIG